MIETELDMEVPKREVGSDSDSESEDSEEEALKATVFTISTLPE